MDFQILKDFFFVRQILKDFVRHIIQLVTFCSCMNDSCKGVCLKFEVHGIWALLQCCSPLFIMKKMLPHFWSLLVSDNMTSLQGINSKTNFVLATWKLRCMPGPILFFAV